MQCPIEGEKSLSVQRNVIKQNRDPLTESRGSPRSKYKHRRASALLRNIQNIRICMEKKPIVSVTYEIEKTVYIKTHKMAINRPVDHTGET